MELYCFDSEEGFLNIEASNPNGTKEVGIANICLPDVYSKALLLAFLTDLFESIGYRRDLSVSYEGLGQGLEESSSKVRVYRKDRSQHGTADFVVLESKNSSMPDMAVSLVQKGAAGLISNHQIRKDIKVAQKKVPSGWLQPFVDSSRRAELDKDPDFQSLCQVARSLQGYLYSAGAGVLPTDLADAFDYDLPDLALDTFKLLHTGPTDDIWYDRPVIECITPIGGIVFGCTADNTIIPMREASDSLLSEENHRSEQDAAVKILRNK